jgi:hypothetical protein
MGPLNEEIWGAGGFFSGALGAYIFFKTRKAAPLQRVLPKKNTNNKRKRHT